MKKIKKYHGDERLARIVEELSKEIRIEKKPKILVSNDPVLFSYGVPNNSVIAIGKDYLNLDIEELKGIIAHELWHIKVDVDSASFIVGQRNKFFIGLAMIGILEFIVALFFYLFQGNLRAILTVSLELGTFIGASLLAFMLIVTSLLALAICGMMYGLLRGIPTLMKTGLRELFADSFAALTIRNPKAVALGILEAHNIFSEDKKIKLEKKYGKLLYLNFVPFSRAGIYSKKEKDWQEIAKLSWFESHPPNFNRIALLFLIDKLLIGKVSLKFTKKLQVVTWREKYGIWLRNPFHVFDLRYLRLTVGSIGEIYRYIISHLQDFNLLECSRSVGIEAFDVFAVFMMFMGKSIIDVIEPSPTMDNIISFLI